MSIYERVRLGEGFVDIPPPVPQPREESAAVVRARILDDAREEAEQLRQTAREQGRRDGQQQARQQALGAVEQLHALAASLADERARIVAAAEAEIVDLVIDAARQLVHGELQTRPEAVVDMIAGALERVADPTRVRLRLHPDDAALVTQHASQAAMRMPELVPDPNLERGDCVVDTGGGFIDARVSARLETLREHLGGVS